VAVASERAFLARCGADGAAGLAPWCRAAAVALSALYVRAWRRRSTPAPGAATSELQAGARGGCGRWQLQRAVSLEARKGLSLTRLANEKRKAARSRPGRADLSKGRRAADMRPLENALGVVTLRAAPSLCAAAAQLPLRAAPPCWPVKKQNAELAEMLDALHEGTQGAGNGGGNGGSAGCFGCGAKPPTPSVRLSQSLSGRVSQSGGEAQSPASRGDRLAAVAVDVTEAPKAL
jgi:hypothetical protein